MHDDWMEDESINIPWDVRDRVEITMSRFRKVDGSKSFQRRAI